MIQLNENINYTRSKPKGYKVAPKSKLQLRKIANEICVLLRDLGCYEGDFINVNYLLECVLQNAGYNYHIVEDNELQNTAAFTIPDEKLIVLRNSIYKKLAVDDPFSRYTVIHEFSHIILNHSVTLHRNAILGTHAWYEDSEWQANNLAAEVLMPVDIIQKYDGIPMLLMDACGVSSQAITYRLSNLEKEGIPIHCSSHEKRPRIEFWASR